MNIEKNAKLKWRRIYWNGKGYDMTEETIVDAEEMEVIGVTKKADNQATLDKMQEHLDYRTQMLTMETDEIVTKKTPTIEIQTLHDERRDLFAAAALTGLLSSDHEGKQRIDTEAYLSFEYADAMIEASKKGDD